VVQNVLLISLQVNLLAVNHFEAMCEHAELKYTIDVNQLTREVSIFIGKKQIAKAANKCLSLAKNKAALLALQYVREDTKLANRIIGFSVPENAI
jgi:hypothetical protein